MKKLLKLCLALAVFGLAVGGGCKKAAVVTPDPAYSLPGAKEVFALIEKKDYDGAMTALAKTKESATTDEQNNQFTALLREAKSKIIETGGSDPKAAEAAAALRSMIMGR